MESKPFELVGKAEARPEFITLADGGKVEVHTFEALIRGFDAGRPFVSGPGAAAMWLVREQQRIQGQRR